MEAVDPVALVEVVIPDLVVDDLRPGSEAVRVLAVVERSVRGKASVLVRESAGVVGLDPGKVSAPVRESAVVMGLDRVRESVPDKGSEIVQERVLARDLGILITRTSMQIASDSGRGPTGRCLLRTGRKI